MKLLLDAGNTLIKWALLDADSSWVAHGAAPTEAPEALAELARHSPSVTAVLGTNVAGTGVGQRIEAVLGSLPRPVWVRSEAQCCGVRNRYDRPAQLGADRWAALIGVRALRSEASLVVTAGTATTVDLLDADGVFLGGLILPGAHLMHRALAGNTAQLDLAEGNCVAMPRNTADAITSGCLQAQAGAIERMFEQIAAQPGARCVLAGGGADPLATLLRIPLLRVDNLVLRGLAVLARTFPAVKA